MGTRGSTLLIHDYPLVVQPKLALAIKRAWNESKHGKDDGVGLNEAIVLQQVQYWLTKRRADESERFYHDGRWWVYNTLDEWAEQFPFWSVATVRRALERLRKLGLLKTGRFNRKGYDRTLWYTIDYSAVGEVANRVSSSSAQDEQMDLLKMSRPIPETTSETTSEKEQGQPSLLESNSGPEVLKKDIPAKKQSETANTGEVYRLFGEYYQQAWGAKYVSSHPGDGGQASRLWKTARKLVGKTGDPSDIIRRRLGVALVIHRRNREGDQRYSKRYDDFPTSIALFASKFPDYIEEKIKLSPQVPPPSTLPDSAEVLAKALGKDWRGYKAADAAKED